MQDLGCTTLHLGQRHLRPGELAMLIERRVPVLFYTVNDAGRAGELLAGGAAGLFTDAPDRLLPLAP